MKDFQKIDWKLYNKPPFYQQWLCRDDTLKLATFGDKGLSDLDDQILALKDQWDLENVKGHFLDRIGKLLNEKRNGNTDDYYRIMLKLRRLLNTNDGSIPSIIKAIKFIYSSEVVHIVPDYPAGLIIEHEGEGTLGLNFNKLLAEIIAAGVSFSTKELFYFLDTAKVSESHKIKPVRRDIDVYPGGLRYDGRWKYDHGDFLRLDGSRTYDGSWVYDLVVGKKGTVTDVRHIPSCYDGTWVFGGDRTYSGETLLNEPEELPNPVTFNSRHHDEMSAHLKLARLEDTCEIIPRYDGRLMYQGWKYGAGNPSILDPSMEIKITRHFLFNGRWTYWGRSFDGSWKYDGSLVYSSGITYSGKQITTEVVA
jgi:hypothetical protein